MRDITAEAQFRREFKWKPAPDDLAELLHVLNARAGYELPWDLKSPQERLQFRVPPRSLREVMENCPPGWPHGSWLDHERSMLLALDDDDE